MFSKDTKINSKYKRMLYTVITKNKVLKVQVTITQWQSKDAPNTQITLLHFKFLKHIKKAAYQETLNLVFCNKSINTKTFKLNSGTRILQIKILVQDPQVTTTQLKDNQRMEVYQQTRCKI